MIQAVVALSAGHADDFAPLRLRLHGPYTLPDRGRRICPVFARERLGDLDEGLLFLTAAKPGCFQKTRTA